MTWVWIALAVIAVSAVGMLVLALRTKTDVPPEPRRCPNCGHKQGTRSRPMHATRAEPVNGHPVSWAILCEPCWQTLTIKRRYEFYAVEARRWDLLSTPEWASIVAAVQVGL